MTGKLTNIVTETNESSQENKGELFKAELIKNYFQQPNLFGRRYCNFNPQIRIKKNGELQSKGSPLSWFLNSSWTDYSWREFVGYLQEYGGEPFVEGAMALANSVN